MAALPAPALPPGFARSAASAADSDCAAGAQHHVLVDAIETLLAGAPGGRGRGWTHRDRGRHGCRASRGSSLTRRATRVLSDEHEHHTENDRDHRRAVIRHRSIRKPDPDDQRSQNPDPAEYQYDAKAARSQTELLAQPSRADRENREREAHDYEQTEHESAHHASLSGSDGDAPRPRRRNDWRSLRRGRSRRNSHRRRERRVSA